MMKTLNPKDQQDLEHIIQMLTKEYSITCIYIHPYQLAASTSYQLILLMSNKYVKMLGELLPPINFALKNFKQFSPLCYIAARVKDDISTGNLHLFNVCQAENLVYQKPGSLFVAYPPDFDASTCLERSQEFFQQEREKVMAFRSGYFYFKEQGIYAQAAFMLQQAIELSCRQVELLLVGKEKITHSIRLHHSRVVELCPLFPPVFKEEEEDQRLLQILESIYRATRYENHYEIDIATLNLLETKMERVLDQVLIVFEDMVANFKNIHQQIASQTQLPPKELPVSPSENPQDTLIALIIEKIPAVTAIYRFGFKKKTLEKHSLNSLEPEIHQATHHYDLLLISDKDIRQEVGNLHSEINQEGDTSVFILAFTPAQVQKQLDANQVFFHQALQFAPPLYINEAHLSPWKFNINNGIRNKEEEDAAYKLWFNREANAAGFYSGGFAIQHVEEVAIKILLYNQAMEQACLGLLEYFYGYQPYQYHLKHLYNLVCSFWSFPDDIFPRSTTEEKEIFDDFTQTVSDTRYKGWSSVDWDEAYRYDERCSRFMEISNELVHGKLVVQSQISQES